MSKAKIERLKKKFWESYTAEFNNNSDAFELMRLIGVEQGIEMQKLIYANCTLDEGVKE